MSPLDPRILRATIYCGQGYSALGLNNANYRRGKEAARATSQTLLQDLPYVWVQKLCQRVQVPSLPGRQPPLEEARTRGQVGLTFSVEGPELDPATAAVGPRVPLPL